MGRIWVQVQNTGTKAVIVSNAAGIAFMGAPFAERAEKLVGTLKDSTERTAASVLASVVEFWQQKFTSDGL